MTMRAITLAFGLALFPAVAAAAQLYAVDGDTLRLGRERIRIVGLDTPETAQAKCADERRRGMQAKLRLARLVAGGRLRIDRAGTDRYRRTLARVSVDGRDVARVMIAEKLAVPYRGGKRIGWCPRPPKRKAAVKRR